MRGLSLGWLKKKPVEENEIDETHPDIEKMANIEEEEASAAPLIDVDEIMNAFIQDVDGMEEATDNESSEVEQPCPSSSQCLIMMNQVRRRFIKSTGTVPDCITDQLLKIPQKDSLITDFIKTE